MGPQGRFLLVTPGNRGFAARLAEAETWQLLDLESDLPPRTGQALVDKLVRHRDGWVFLYAGEGGTLFDLAHGAVRYTVSSADLGSGIKSAHIDGKGRDLVLLLMDGRAVAYPLDLLAEARRASPAPPTSAQARQSGVVDPRREEWRQDLAARVQERLFCADVIAEIESTEPPGADRDARVEMAAEIGDANLGLIEDGLWATILAGAPDVARIAAQVTRVRREYPDDPRWQTLQAWLLRERGEAAGALALAERAWARVAADIGRVAARSEDPVLVANPLVLAWALPSTPANMALQLDCLQVLGRTGEVASRRQALLKALAEPSPQARAFGVLALEPRADLNQLSALPDRLDEWLSCLAKATSRR